MNSLKIFLLVLFAGLGLGACQNFLIPDLDNQYQKDRFYTDPQWALGLMLQGYVTSTAFPAAYPMDEVATDDAVSNDPTNNYLRMATGEWTALFDPSNIWASSYAAILNLNYFLSLSDQVQWSWQDTTRNRLFKTRYKAEATGLRGYYYYKLLERCGGYGADGTKLGAPIVNGIITSNDNWKIQRSSWDSTFNQAASDLNLAIALLPYTYYDIANPVTNQDISWNRVNGAGKNQNLLDGRACRGIKARLYLLGASPAFNNGSYDLIKADSVVHICGRVLTASGGLGILSGDPIYWDNNNDISNTDIMWRTDYGSSNTLESQNYPPSLYGSGRVNPTQNFVDCFPMKNGYPITDAVNSGYDPQNPYTNRDSRLNMIVLYNGGKERISGTLGSNNVINTQADNAVNSDGLNKLPLYSTRTGYYLKKELRVDVSMTPGSTSSQQHFYTRFRFTELFLMFAEAANEVYGPDGANGFAFTPRQIIAALRQRGAGIAGGGITGGDPYLATITTAAQMRDMIRNERRIELSFEGFRFWDLRRWKVPYAQLTAGAKGVYITGSAPIVYNYAGTGVSPVENRVYQPWMYYGPIPFLETKKYPGFIQNAGW